MCEAARELALPLLRIIKRGIASGSTELSGARRTSFDHSPSGAGMVLCLWPIRGRLRLDRVSKETHPAAPQDSDAHHAPNWKQLLLWAALAADASALLLAVTNHISQDIAAVPLLWIVPLSLYLLSLILCFENGRWYRRSFFLRLLAVALAGMTYSLAPEFANAGPSLQIPLFCIGLFVCCMVCHGELARLKPDPRHLTSFYLMIAAGGAFGGIVVGVIAPRIFHDFYELPIALAGCELSLWFVSLRLLEAGSDIWRRVFFFGGAAIVTLGFAFLPYLSSPHIEWATRREISMASCECKMLRQPQISPRAGTFLMGPSCTALKSSSRGAGPKPRLITEPNREPLLP